MQTKLENPPEGLTGRDISRVLKVLNLIDNIIVSSRAMVGNSRVDGHLGLVMALVDILEEVLDSSNRRTDFNIDVGIVLCAEPEVVRNNPSVVHREAISSHDMTSIVTSPILRVATVVDLGFFHQRAWVVLGAILESSFVVSCHAGSIRVACSTGAMHHGCGDCLKCQGTCLWIRNFG